MEHHAYLYQAATKSAANLPPKVIDQSPDIEHLSYERLGIDEARELARRASLMSVGGSRRYFVVFAAAITLEAQNALLKLFEDPPSGAVFHLIVPNVPALVPTLRSRFHEVEAGESPAATAAFTAFWQASYADRLAQIADRHKSKDTAWQQTIYQGMMAALAADTISPERRVAALFLNAFPRRGASKKMLLELLALALPGA